MIRSILDLPSLSNHIGGPEVSQEFPQSQYFNTVLVSTIRFLEPLPAKSPNEKSQLLRGLQRVLPVFLVSVLERKLLDALMDELKDLELVFVQRLSLSPETPIKISQNEKDQMPG